MLERLGPDTFSSNISSMEMLRPYLRIYTPGHSWLRVPLSELDALEIRDNITEYSPKDHLYSYLEEDCDLVTFIEAKEIVYHHYQHIGVAVGTQRGLVVPVIRHAEKLSFAQMEQAIIDFVAKINENRLDLADLEGGTFTISNGGVYGSLLSTPILNMPQSAILGMHKIEKRPVAVDDDVVIRPMMYVALSYDHRIVDGREAVTFLKRIKELVESPERMIMEI